MTNKAWTRKERGIFDSQTDLSAFLQKSQDRALFSYIFIQEARSSGVRASIIIDLLAIQQKSLEQALFLYIFIREVRSSGVRASITIVHIRKFYKVNQSIVRLRFFFRIAKGLLLDLKDV